MRSLTTQQRQLIELFIDGEIQPEQVTGALGEISLDTSTLLLLLLESAVVNGVPREAELAFGMLRSFSDKKQFAKPAVPLLLQLLVIDTHQWHEAIIGAFRYMKDDRTVEGVFDYISTLPSDFIAFYPTIARKAAWALANVGNESAYRRLETLTLHPDLIVAGYAQKRIDAWEREQGRKVFHFSP